MLLLVTIVLVLIAAVTLLIGIFGDNLFLIFVSIGASALAAIVLAVLSQVSRRKVRDATASTIGPAPLTPEPATANAGTAAVSAPASPAVTPVPREQPTIATAPVVAAPVAAPALPIANYDGLRVNEILPKLEDLDLDQLEEIAQHEETNRNRTTILNRIDELMDQLEAAEAGAASVGAGVVDVPEPEEIESGDVVPEAAVSGGFPIPDYETMTEAEVIAMLADLDADELEEVAEYEETHANRDRVLDAIDDRLDELEGIAPAASVPAAPSPVAPAAPLAPVRTVKKTAARKAATTKKVAATGVTSAAARKVAATPVKKAAASTKKAAASTKKVAASTTKKAAPVKKAAVKKAGVKKAAAATKATKATKKTR